MKITENAKLVLERRYLIKDEKGEVTETVEGLFQRVASSIAEADRNFDPDADVSARTEEFYEMLTNLEFLPNSPTLMNAGRPLGQLSACFVLPIEDSMEKIFETVKQAALIHKSGGGTGFSFSRLRPNGAPVNTTGGIASGPISFMKVFNMATEAVKQGGTRRGANMGILRVDHPDILEFIDCKQDTAEITNFNISVGITEVFMEAVKSGSDYDLIDPYSGKAVGSLNAAEVFDKIVSNAWNTGEPGIIFLDRLNRDNVVPEFGEIESTNPCGEQPLLPYESCNLGSINLVAMLDKLEDGSYQINYDRLGNTVDKAVHFLDNVIEVNKYPLAEIDYTTKQIRKIGLGIMGFADMLLYLGVPYNSDEGIALGEKIMSFITARGKSKSKELAKTRGSFPLFETSTLKDGDPIRNGTVTTIAPTGTLSIIAGVSSGIEPVFAYVFIRNVMDSTKMIEVNPVLKQALIDRGLYSDELMEKIASAGTLAHIEEIPEDIRKVFVSSHDISPEYHIRMQAAFQKYTDNAVSKTVNFVSSATKEDVREVYVKAYETGCKGVTIYRDGSRSGQVLSIKKEEEKTENTNLSAVREISPRPRPDITMGITERMKIGCGNLYVTVNYDENGICEVFTSTGKAGGCPSQSEATARLASIALRSGISVEEILDQLKGIRCPSTVRQKGMQCTSCPDAIAKVIKKVYDMQKNGTPMIVPNATTEEKKQPPTPAKEESVETASKAIKHCPECGDVLEHEGGCVICRNCGYSKCS